MDDLLREFLAETTESLDVLDVELVKFEREPDDARILANIFRLVHTIKGTCGFLGLPRLASLAHAAETLLARFRDGAPVTADGVTAVLDAIDRIKAILAQLQEQGAEPAGGDEDLIARFNALRTGETIAAAPPEAELDADSLEALDELERAFQAAPGPEALDLSPESASGFAAEAIAERRQARPEADLQAAPPAKAIASAASVRIQVSALEHLMEMVGELVLTRNQLLDTVRRLGDNRLRTPLQRLSNITAELQSGVMKARMQPIGDVWRKLPRLVRDLSRELGKPIQLQTKGDDTGLDRQVLELIKDPLTHMVRNCADHGLEDAETRRTLGKPETGCISLSARHEGSHVIVEISDDGRGLDASRIRAKAAELGLATPPELDRMSDAQVQRFIFQPGFSTAARVTSVSGRGVGLDVVRANIEQIGGSVDVHSVKGEGTIFTIKIPLTLAIVSALIVKAAGQRFAIPQLSVLELVRASRQGEHRIESINGAAVLRLRGALLPLIGLGRLLRLQHAASVQDRALIAVLRVGVASLGLLIDEVCGSEEIVVKPLSSPLRDLELFSGNTILGDGSVVMILDPVGLAHQVAGAGVDLPRHDAADREDENAADEETEVLLLFHAGSPEPKAVPLPAVARLEEIDMGAVETLDDRAVVQYRGGLLPLVALDGGAPTGEGDRPVLVFSDGRRLAGLVVDDVVDIVEDKLSIEVASSQPGLIGSAIVKGRATGIVDASYVMRQGCGEAAGRGASTRPHGQGRAQGCAEARALLVDDSGFFRALHAPVISAAGYAVTEAASAAEAVRLLSEQGPFDIVVADLELPDVAADALARALQCDAARPLIGLSSRLSEAALESGRRAGFREVVGKFDRKRLAASLEAHGMRWAAAA